MATPTAFERLGVVRRRWWILLACVLVLPPAVYAYSSSRPEVYASDLVAQGSSERPSTPAGGYAIVNAGSARLAAGYVGTPDATQETVRLLADEHPLASISASVDPETGWLTLTAASTDPDAARATLRPALRGVQHALQKVAERQAANAIASIEASLTVLRDPVERQQARDQRRELRTLRAAPVAGFQVVDGPSAATVIEPNPGRNAVLALLLAFLVAPVLMLFAERTDRHVRRADEVEDTVGAPLLASLPAPPAAGTRAAAERERELERLRDSLVHFEPGVPLSSVIVVSPLPDDGRTTTARDLATAFARGGRRVVLVLADLRGGGPGGPGLTEVLAGVDLGEAVRPPLQQDGYFLLPAGSAGRRLPDPAALLEPERVSRLLDALATDFDLVVVDTPPLLTVSDTLALLHQVSGVICIVRLDRTPRHAVKRMKAIIEAAGGRILGAVATGSRAGTPPDFAPATTPGGGQQNPLDLSTGFG